MTSSTTHFMSFVRMIRPSHTGPTSTVGTISIDASNLYRLIFSNSPSSICSLFYQSTLSPLLSKSSSGVNKHPARHENQYNHLRLTSTSSPTNLHNRCSNSLSVPRTSQKLKPSAQYPSSQLSSAPSQATLLPPPTCPPPTPDPHPTQPVHTFHQTPPGPSPIPNPT